MGEREQMQSQTKNNCQRKPVELEFVLPRGLGGWSCDGPFVGVRIGSTVYVKVVEMDLFFYRG